MSGGLFDHLINQFGNGQQMTTDSFNVNPQPQHTNGYNINQQMALQQKQQQMLANMGLFNGFGGMGGNNMIANFGWNQPQYGQQKNNNLGYGYNGYRWCL